MIRKIYQTLIRYLPVDYFKYRRSYAQEGEDMILKELLLHKKNYKGFFVDVGAHHPVRYSNTRCFYKRGWRGINIEPTPSAMGAFKIFRTRDINLSIGIGPARGKLKFYCFNDPALNSFSQEVSERIDQGPTKYKITRILDIDVLPLSEMFDRYLPTGQKIDFLTIDVEGFDFNVLKSNNWDRYKPDIILVEENLNIDSIKDAPIYNFLIDRKYTFYAKTSRTCIYRLEG